MTQQVMLEFRQLMLYKDYLIPDADGHYKNAQLCPDAPKEVKDIYEAYLATKEHMLEEGTKV